jgi:microcompartment protein CcmK/EutM
MQVLQVKKTLLLTSRLENMGHFPVKALVDENGVYFVALHPVGAREGEWVFTIANSAARTATGYEWCLTDLTVGGIIDNWQDIIGQ